MYPFDLANKNGYNDVENLIKRFLSACKIQKLKANHANPTELLEYLSKKFANENANLDELLESNLEENLENLEEKEE